MNGRFKELRKTLQMNMEQFGKILGISKSGVSEIESGRRNVTEQHIRLLTANPIDGKVVSETWLRTGVGEMFTQQAGNEDEVDQLLDRYSLPRELHALFDGYLKLSPAAKAEIREMFRECATRLAGEEPPTPEQKKGIEESATELGRRTSQDAVPKSSGTSSGR